MRDPMPNEPLDDAERELQALAENIDVEEQQAAAAMAQLAIDGEVDLESEKDDDTEGWIDRAHKIGGGHSACKIGPGQGRQQASRLIYMDLTLVVSSGGSHSRSSTRQLKFSKLGGRYLPNWRYQTELCQGMYRRAESQRTICCVLYRNIGWRLIC